MKQKTMTKTNKLKKNSNTKKCQKKNMKKTGKPCKIGTPKKQEKNSKQ
jgi:hypothetical protein